MKNSKLRKCSVISYEAKCTGWRVVESFFVPRQKDRLNEDAFLCMEIYIGISCRSLLHTLQKNLFLFVKACCTVLYRVLCFYISQSIINTSFWVLCIWKNYLCSTLRKKAWPHENLLETCCESTFFQSFLTDCVRSGLHLSISFRFLCYEKSKYAILKCANKRPCGIEKQDGNCCLNIYDRVHRNCEKINKMQFQHKSNIVSNKIHY